MLTQFLKALLQAPACVACGEQEATRGLLCVDCHDVETLAAESLAHEVDCLCAHDYQLETVGGVFLTGAYVCRLCSDRIGMSQEQFHRHADYPRHYQEGGHIEPPEPNPR
jgi:hypothetical protein